jgi:hypothetical protein
VRRPVITSIMAQWTAAAITQMQYFYLKLLSNA